VADGVTNVLYYITKELAKRGHEVHVYASNMLDLHGKDSIKAADRVVNGVDVSYLRSLWRYKTFIVTPSVLPLLSKNLTGFDIIHIHDCRCFQGISTYLFAEAESMPYVLQPHGSYLSSSQGSFNINLARSALDKLVSDRIFRNAAKVIALTNAEAYEYSCAGVPKEKIAIVPNGIDLSEYANLPSEGFFKKKFGLDENEKIILYLGRIHKIKGIDILVRAFSNVVKKLDDAKLVIAGPDDGYLRETVALVNALKVEKRVVFAGPLYGRDKLEAYVDADVYVLPSRYETFPMSILEALACGTPTILTENCGISEDFKDGAGLVVKPDSDHLSEALIEMLMSRAKQKVFRKNRSTLPERFSISGTVSRLERVYEGIEKRPRRILS
jgi:glycosyltransferase involved in cell wall biosynthesis